MAFISRISSLLGKWKYIAEERRETGYGEHLATNKTCKQRLLEAVLVVHRP
jgi:hypothetical protein